MFYRILQRLFLIVSKNNLQVSSLNARKIKESRSLSLNNIRTFHSSCPLRSNDKTTRSYCYTSDSNSDNNVETSLHEDGYKNE